MRFSLGAHIGQQNLAMGELRALWRRLDAAGLDWISVWDHLYESPPAGGTEPHFESVSTLGALCADTQRARIGCLVFNAAYRNPGILAKAATTLDHISSGRFELGLGAGWHRQEAQAFGIDFPAPGARLDLLEEMTPLMRSLLSEERTTHEGEYFRIRDASCLPAPVGRHIPLWIGGIGEKRTLRIAARHADGWNAVYVDPTTFKHLCDVLDGWCATEDRDPAEIERSVNVMFLGATKEDDTRRVLNECRDSWGEMAPRVMDGALVGGPERCVERIVEYAWSGAQGVNITLRAPWDPEALDAFLEIVMPAVHRELG